jgi:hypothetical protein
MNQGGEGWQNHTLQNNSEGFLLYQNILIIISDQNGQQA